MNPVILWSLFLAGSFGDISLWAGPAAAKLGALQGRVSAADLPQSVSGASLQLSGSTRVFATSDMDGQYYLEAPAGSYVLRIAATGFVDLSLTVRVLPAQERRLNAQLIRANMMAEPVVVRATRSGIPAEVMAHMNVPLTPTPTAEEKKWAPVAKVFDRTFKIGIFALILLSAFGITKI